MRKALVVGGANGIGLSIATILAKSSGYEKIYILDKVLVSDEQYSPKYEFIQFDLISNVFLIFVRFKKIDTKLLTITKNTVSIHHYDASWAEWYDRAAGERGPKLQRLLGYKLGQKINVTIYVVQKYGLFGCIKKIFGK